MNMQTETNSKRNTLLFSAGLILLILLAFEPLRHNGFVDYDDNSYITENRHIQDGFTSKAILWAFTSGYASNWHPLTWLSHILDIELFGLNPLGHHLHSLFLHLVTAILLFIILHKMTGIFWCSGFTALVFGIHPLRVESVAWASERKDVLCALFWMLTILVYLHYVKKGGVWRYLMVTICFILGLTAKPMIVTLPIILLLLDYWPLKRVQKSTTRLIIEKIPLLLSAGISCIITYYVQQSGGSMGNAELKLGPRIANALTAYAAYLDKIFWPRNMAMLYPYSSDMPFWQPAVAFLILAIISGLVIYRLRKQLYLATGWFWYIITLIPVIGLVQVGSQSMADRYTYLPSIGISFLTCWGVVQITAQCRYQKAILIILSVAAVTAMTIQTRKQLTYWKDTISLFEHTLAATKDNYTIHHNLGWILWKQHKVNEAFTHIERSLQIWPDFPEANIDMAVMLTYLNQPEQAVRHLHKALEIKPDNAMAYYNMGIALQFQEKETEALEAYARAAKYFQQRLQEDPDNAEIHRNLGFVLQQQGQLEDAVIHYSAALKINPNDSQACWNIAVINQMMGRYGMAVDFYRRLLKLKPDSAEAINSLAWILATTPDSAVQNPQEAIALAKNACILTSFEDLSTLDTLAAAYAANGQFGEAVETAQKALDLAKAAGHQNAFTAIEKRLQLYQAGKPYLATQSESNL